MAYFTSDFLQFFSELRENNEREWFHAEKKRYETTVKKPFEAFIEAMIERIQIEDPSLIITPKECVFRIHRDTRFSKDKTPYKLHASAAINHGGRKDHSRPGIYMQANEQSFGIYSGIYRADSKTLQRIREEMVSNAAEFSGLIADKNFKTHFGEILGEKNKRIPKEFREAAEEQPLLYHKQFYYCKELDAATILKEDLVDEVMKYYKASRPLSAFLARAIVE